MPVDLVVLDGVAYSEKITGPWVPMSTTTAIFREPKKHHHDFGYVHTPPMHDPANKAIDDTEVFIPNHQPPAHKLFTSQS
jgi:hypothetical protein